MKPKDVLALVAVAGYHRDDKAGLDLRVSGRISVAAWQEAWSRGVNAKRNGAKCSCFECKTQERDVS